MVVGKLVERLIMASTICSSKTVMSIFYFQSYVLNMRWRVENKKESDNAHFKRKMLHDTILTVNLGRYGVNCDRFSKAQLHLNL